MKRTVLIACILFASMHALQAQSDYININDTLTIIGVKITHPLGLKKYHSVIQESRKEEPVVYTPDDISEFCINKNIFVSMVSPIEGEENKVFLHRVIIRDSIAVYLYQDKTGKHFFFGTQNQGLKEITPQNNLYAEYLSSEYGSDSKHPINQYRIKLNSQSILFAEKLVRTGNSNLLSRPRYGVWIGAGSGRLTKDIMPNDNSDTHLLVGAFANIPVYRQLSLQTELFYMQEAYSMNKTNPEYITDKIYNRKSIVMPIMPRFSFNWIKGKVIPYIQAGPTIHFALKKKEEEQTVHIHSNNVNITQPPTIEEKNYFYTGINGGGGLEYKFTRRHSIFWDIRYMRTFGKDTHSLFYTTLSVNI